MGLWILLLITFWKLVTYNLKISQICWLNIIANSTRFAIIQKTHHWAFLLWCSQRGLTGQERPLLSVAGPVLSVLDWKERGREGSRWTALPASCSLVCSAVVPTMNSAIASLWWNCEPRQLNPFEVASARYFVTPNERNNQYTDIFVKV